MTPPRLDQFLGCLLGQAVGDSLGAPLEGLPSDHIYWTFGVSLDLVEKPLEDELRYTDDTQMMIGVAETLAACGRIDEAVLCRAFVDNYHPDRCYGPGARRVLEAMAAGEDWRTLARVQFPGGSLGNGAAMRVAPVGLLFCDDLDRVAEEARLSALPTHVHPLGIEGAQVLALAVALAAREPRLNRKRFYRELLARVQSEEFRWALSFAAQIRPGDPVGTLGNTLAAHRSVVTAVATFASSPRSYSFAVGRAIGLGNDTDTLAAMTGALSGAHLGVRAIPAHLIERLEDGNKGCSYLKELAERLCDRFQQRLHPA